MLTIERKTKEGYVRSSVLVDQRPILRLDGYLHWHLPNERIVLGRDGVDPVVDGFEVEMSRTGQIAIHPITLWNSGSEHWEVHAYFAFGTDAVLSRPEFPPTSAFFSIGTDGVMAHKRSRNDGAWLRSQADSRMVTEMWDRLLSGQYSILVGMEASYKRRYTEWFT